MTGLTAEFALDDLATLRNIDDLILIMRRYAPVESARFLVKVAEGRFAQLHKPFGPNAKLDGVTRAMFETNAQRHSIHLPAKLKAVMVQPTAGGSRLKWYVLEVGIAEARTYLEERKQYFTGEWNY